jgi:apolipoprotein N-acyltransferase
MDGTAANRQDAETYIDSAYEWLIKRPIFIQTAIAFLSGALFSRIFAPSNIFPLTFLIIPFWALMIDKAKTGSKIFGFGWWAGFGLLSLGLHWIGYSFTQQREVPEILAPFAIMGLAGLLSLFVASAFWLLWRLKVKGWARPLIFASVWTLFEIARGHLFTGFPWHIVGSMWADWIWIAQGAHYFSVYGLSFITIFTAAGLYEIAVKGSWQRLLNPAIGFALLIAITAVGYNRLPDDIDYHKAVSLRLVQANVKQREKWISYLIEDHFDSHMALSRSTSKRGKADGVKLLIWPETAIQWQDFDRDSSIPRWRVSRLLQRGSYMITGAPRYQAAGNDFEYYNSLFAVNSDGEVTAQYDKKHLVPFGEYLPFRGVLEAIGLSQLTGGASFSEGPGAKTIALPGVPAFSPLICYEVIFPGAVVANDPNQPRPEWLLNITNDGWFGLTEGPYQHLALARFRAIEEGLPLVRNAGGGVSAVIDPYGRTISKLDVNAKGVLDSKLPKAIAAPVVSMRVVILILTLICSGIVLSALATAMRTGKKR